KRASELLELETDLRRAIKREEFEIHYQPIVELDTRVITGFEALIRWQHPKRGLVPQLEFIPLAEETGMIVDIGKWVLREACRQLQVWHKQFPMHPLITLSVNVSGKQLARAGFIDYVKKVIEETGVDARCLKIELTESVVMANPKLATSILAELRNLNVQVHVDDFGTGYSSLSYLHKFPIDALKVDRSFVSNIGLKEQNLEIVRTIVLLAHNLNLTVIAEGVETEEQLQHLRKIGCNQAQGYYFSRPVVSQQATTLLKTRQLNFDPQVSTGFSRSEKNRRRRKAV
ncbi:MAG TPA: EAL domain-containing protein, partial [Candidatus Binatia bacterium]|nr:EAL domain-containing protein [Candidatus Binatia bacterium]